MPHRVDACHPTLQELIEEDLIEQRKQAHDRANKLRAIISERRAARKTSKAIWIGVFHIAFTVLFCLMCGLREPAAGTNRAYESQVRCLRDASTVRWTDAATTRAA